MVNTKVLRFRYEALIQCVKTDLKKEEEEEKKRMGSLFCCVFLCEESDKFKEVAFCV